MIDERHIFSRRQKQLSVKLNESGHELQFRILQKAYVSLIEANHTEGNKKISIVHLHNLYSKTLLLLLYLIRL
jgi:hypothetical protein